MCRRVVEFTYGKCRCTKTIPYRWILYCSSAKCVARVDAGRKKPEPFMVRKKGFVCPRHQKKWGIEVPNPALNGLRDEGPGHGSRKMRHSQEHHEAHSDFSAPRGGRSHHHDDRYEAMSTWTDDDSYISEADVEPMPPSPPSTRRDSSIYSDAGGHARHATVETDDEDDSPLLSPSTRQTFSVHDDAGPLMGEGQSEEQPKKEKEGVFKGVPNPFKFLVSGGDKASKGRK